MKRKSALGLYRERKMKIAREPLFENTSLLCEAWAGRSRLID